MSTGNGQLDQATLEACAGRAAGYDRDNRFFFEDFEALKKTGSAYPVDSATPYML
jgi:hypothetical protein